MDSNNQREGMKGAGLGLCIARRRLALGWTRRQLAQRLDLSPGELGQYESGAAEPSGEMVDRIGRLLGLPAEMLEGAPEPSNSASVASRRSVSVFERSPFTEILDTLLDPEESPASARHGAREIVGRHGSFPERAREAGPAEPPLSFDPIALAALEDAEAATDEASSDSYEQIFLRLERKATETQARLEREDGQAWELLRLTDDERRALLANQGERFSCTGVALRLVRESEAKIEGEVDRAERLAMDTLTVLGKIDRVPPKLEVPPALHREIGVRAWCCLAQIARRRNDLAGAETCLDRAAVLLGGVGTDVRALYCRVLGLIRADRGRIDEALALLGRAADLLREVGEERQRGEILERAGWLCLRDLADPLPAIELFQNASAAFRHSKAPAAAGAAQLAIAWALHQAGLTEWVPQALGLARAQLEARPAADPERVRLEWLAAWLETQLGAGATGSATAPAGAPGTVGSPFAGGLPISPVRH
jgi:transcriptional regulator with XRE-family HTH domain